VADLLTRGFEAQARALREFGYSGVKPEQIAEAHRKWLAGEAMGNIIEMMSESAFNEHPEIFGERPGDA